MHRSLVSRAISLVVTLIAVPALHAAEPGTPPSLPFAYEELTAPDFVRAVERSARTVVIPFGILEKHGPHLPLGTDLIAAREVARRAAQQEYVVVFPPY